MLYEVITRENVLASFPEDALPSSAFLAGLIEGAGLSVPMSAVEKLVDHAREMLRWNRSIRLTAITEPAEVADQQRRARPAESLHEDADRPHREQGQQVVPFARRLKGREEDRNNFV